MPTTLTPEEMRTIVERHFDDFVNKKKPEVIYQNMTADFYDHDGPGGKPIDAAGDEAMMRAMQKMIPDLTIEILSIVAEGDRVICRNRWTGTNVQTGKKIEFHGFVEWRFEGGKIAERWATVTQPA